MTDTPPTPGQIAFAVYWQVHAQEGTVQVRVPFAGIPEVSQRAWEAAAQAVLALHEESPVVLDLDPDVQREEQA